MARTGNAVAAAIEAAAQAAWIAAGQSSASLGFGNKHIDAPASGLWGRVTVVWSGAAMLTMGSRGSTQGYDELAGTLMFSIFGPQGAGMGPVEALADTLAAAFARLVVGEAVFSAPGLPQRADDADSGQVMITLSCPFSATEAVD